MPMNADLQYPIFISLADRSCLVIGLGAVGIRKLEGLLACSPASVLVLDLRKKNELPEEARDIIDNAGVTFECRKCTKDDVSASSLVFACTGDNSENLRIAGLCADIDVLCNCVTDPSAGSFSVPAVVRSGKTCLALSTGGQSPALARKWRMELSCWLDDHQKMACLLGHLRPMILDLRLDSRQNALLFRKIVNSPLQDWLARNKLKACSAWLETHLPEKLRERIPEIINDLS